MAIGKELIQLQFEDGTPFYVEAAVLDKERDVAFTKALQFKVTEIVGFIENFANVLHNALEKAKPNKATIEFGVKIGTKSGELTALLVEAEGSADLKITLEWNDSKR